MRKLLSKNSAKHFLVIMSAAATVTLGMTPYIAHAADVAEEQEVLTAVAGDGWVQTGDDWYYIKDGTYVCHEWVQYNGAWYFFGYDNKMIKDNTVWIWDDNTDQGYMYGFDGNGHMVTGWQKYDRTWYYFEADGRGANGVRSLGGKTYYFCDGAMYSNTTVVADKVLYKLGRDGAVLWQASLSADGWVNTKDGYYYVKDGMLVRGEFVKDGGYTYYLDYNGIMLEDAEAYLGDFQYRFAKDGHMITGWYKDYNWVYYSPEDGHMVTGVQTIDGRKYCFASYGAMRSEVSVADAGVLYYFGMDGYAEKQVSLATDGWIEMPDGTYYARNGELVMSDWVQVGNERYYVNNYGRKMSDAITYGTIDGYYSFDKDGHIRTGWQEDDGKWYYFGADGLAVSGMQTIDGQNYYMAYDGQMITNKRFLFDGTYYNIDMNGICTPYNVQNGWIDDTYYAENGKLVQGWKNVSGKWYYFDSNCELVHGTSCEIDGKTYRFDSNGAMVTGWIQEYNNSWYYADADGAYVMNDWRNLAGTWYYFDENGRMLTGMQNIWEEDEMQRHFFSANGAWICELDAKQKQSQWYSDGKDWYYVQKGSLLRWDILEDGNDIYGFGWNGRMMTDDSFDGYYFGEDGRAYKNRWRKTDTNAWYYYDADGQAVCDDWMLIDGVWYYFDSDGYMLNDCQTFIDGKLNYFAESGAWIGENANPAGWTLMNGFWKYYENGNAVTGWRGIDGAMYFFDSFGLMSYYDAVYDKGETYWLNKDGKMAANGWIELKNGDEASDWLYANADGSLCRGIQVIDGKKYYFDEYYVVPYLFSVDRVSNDKTVLYQHNADDSVTEVAASTINGWYQSADGKWFYVRGGKFVMNYQVIDGREYYFNDLGWMVSDTDLYIGFADANGVIHHDGWCYVAADEDDEDSYSTWKYYRNSEVLYGAQSVNGQYYVLDYGRLNRLYFTDGCYYYYDGNGNRTPQTLTDGWNYIGGNWYYMEDDSLARGVKEINGVYYVFIEDGRMATKSTLYEGCYVENGKLATGWRKINGGWYYFNASGHMVTGTRLIDGAYYTFAQYSGKWIE